MIELNWPELNSLRWDVPLIENVEKIADAVDDVQNIVDNGRLSESELNNTFAPTHLGRYNLGAAFQTGAVTAGWDTDIHQRVPFRLHRPAKRWRVGIQALNSTTGTLLTPAVTFSGVYVGEPVTVAAAGSRTGSFSAAPISVGGGAMVGGKFLTPWNDTPLPATELLLSVGWTSQAGQPMVTNAQGGWVAPGAAGFAGWWPGAGGSQDFNLVPAGGGYWDMWIEYEYEETASPGRARTRVVLGSSLGTNFGLAGPEGCELVAWPQRVSALTGDLVVNLSIPGATASVFNETTLARAGDVVPDEVILFHLSNNFAAGLSASDAGVLEVAVIQAVYAKWPHARIVMLTEPGRDDYTAAQNSERKLWNWYMLGSTYPLGIDSMIDVDTLVSNGNVLADWAKIPGESPSVHFSDRAHQVISRAVA